MRIDPREFIAGVPALEIRRLLRRLDDGWLTTSVQRFLGVGSDKARRVARELSKRGLIEKYRSDKNWYWRRTIAGGAFGLATAAPPMSRDKVERLRAHFLDRVREVNSSPDFLYEVERVEVFGSYLTGAERLNDLDLAVVLRPKQPDSKVHLAACEAQSRAAQAAGRRFGSYVDFLFWPQRKVQRHLKLRLRGLSLHDVDDVNQIGATSRTIFTLPN